MPHRALALLAAIIVLTACASRPPVTADSPTEYVRLDTTAGEITLALDRARAPISVANFLAYAQRGAYDGTIFHRVIPTFVIQGGGYTPELAERATIDAAAGRPDAPIKNEWQNGLQNTRGTIAMARESDPDTATREFYINVADNPKLDSPRPTTGNAGYAVFGRVIEGMDVVDAIKSGPTRAIPERDMADVPVDPVVIKSVRRISEAEAKR